MYTEQVMDHFMNPRNVGEIEDASGVGTVGNAKCGDIMKIYIKVENDVITDVKFKTFAARLSPPPAVRPKWSRARPSRRPSRSPTRWLPIRWADCRR